MDPLSKILRLSGVEGEAQGLVPTPKRFSAAGHGGGVMKIVPARA
jgi:hypothetical protein